MSKKNIFSGLVAILVAIVSLHAFGQTDTAFTYQGELKNNGNAANGIFSMTFALFDAEVGGNQVSLGVSISSVPVVDGKFTVGLDLGADAFDNSDRWLEIIVEGTTLSPRQPVTRAPYAIQTRGIFVDDNQNVGIGTVVPTEKVHVRGDVPTLRLQDRNLSNSYSALRDAGQAQAQLQKVNPAGNVLIDIDPIPLDGSGDASLRLFRSTNTIGEKRVSFFRGNNTTQTSAVIGLDGADSYFQIHGGNVGIGTASPNKPLHVVSNRPGGLVVSSNTLDPSTAIVAHVSNSVNGAGVLGTSSPAGTGVAGQGGGFDFLAIGEGIDYGSNSSRRWKSNIVAIDRPLKKISQLRGVYFDWDAEHGGRHDVGMIAEEVGEVLPEIVRYEENGVDAIGMDYSKLTPLLVEAVNALREEKDAEISELKQQNGAMQKQIQDLQRLMERYTSSKEELPK